ncbi:MAG: four helix bundle protein [Myxococcales bacterium]|nr:four helix bundle protein [Myxococcales bacterium]
MTQARIPLQALEVSLQLIDALAPMIRTVAQHDRSLMDQLRRAAQSISLNLAEALGHRAGNRRLRLETALGSAYETRTALHIIGRWGYADGAQVEHALELVDRVGAMTYRLLHPRR